MKKIISCFLVSLICFGLVACGTTSASDASSVPQVQSIESTSAIPSSGPDSQADLVDSGKSPKYPEEMLSSFMKEKTVIFNDVPDTIYTTFASENGFKDTFMYITGEIKSFDKIKEEDVTFIETSKGKVCLVRSQKLNGITKQSEWNLLEVGKTYGIFFRYEGFSDVTQTAIGTFCNMEIEEGLSEDDIKQMANEKNIALGKQKLNELLTITKISTSKPNSAGGVDVSVSWKNNSEKEIKYIRFQMQAFNAVGDSVRSEIGNRSLFNLEDTGPFKGGVKNTSKGKNAWYNKTIVKANIDSIEIEYMDGTSEEIQGHEVGDEWIQ